jgi:carbonic anhydrase
MCLVESARSSVLAELPNATMEEQVRACEQRSILVSLENLMTFSWVRESVEAGKLSLHGWYFDIEHGQLLSYNSEKNHFEALM